MKEAKANLWTFPAELKCITTNGFIKRDGTSVMGRGCAREAALRYPDLPAILGRSLADQGNHVTELKYHILSFPVKHNWWEKADLELIRRSAEELQGIINFRYDNLQAINGVVLPRPGCGNGHLTWEQVKPILESILDDTVTVVTL